LVQRGAVLLSKADTDQHALEQFKQQNASALCVGLILFALATSTFFTPLPIFFARNMTLQTSTIFILFLLKSAGAFLGYFRIQRKADQPEGNRHIRKVTLSRGGLALLPIIVGVSPFLGAIALSMMMLTAMGLTYAFYSASVLSLSMEVIPRGKAGLFSALIGTGSAIGCLAGTLIAEKVGFQYTFIASAACFLLGFIAFAKFE